LAASSGCRQLILFQCLKSRIRAIFSLVLSTNTSAIPAQLSRGNSSALCPATGCIANQSSPNDEGQSASPHNRIAGRRQAVVTGEHFVIWRMVGLRVVQAPQPKGQQPNPNDNQQPAHISLISHRGTETTESKHFRSLSIPLCLRASV